MHKSRITEKISSTWTEFMIANFGRLIWKIYKLRFRIVFTSFIFRDISCPKALTGSGLVEFLVGSNCFIPPNGYPGPKIIVNNNFHIFLRFQSCVIFVEAAYKYDCWKEPCSLCSLIWRNIFLIVSDAISQYASLGSGNTINVFYVERY